MAEMKKAAAKTEPTKEIAKTEPVKNVEAAKKTAIKKTPVKKAAATKAAATKTAAAKKEVIKENVNFEFSGKSYTSEKLLAIAKDVWKFDLQKKVSDIKSIDLYVKPEENAAYYVINGDVTGSFFI